jgi:restriction system protein
MIPSRSATTIASRVAWAKTFLKQAGLVQQPKRGMVEITDRGRSVLSNNPKAIDDGFLMQFPEFVQFKTRTKAHTDDTKPAPVINKEESSTPEEQITAAQNLLHGALRDALLTRILESSPAFFERLIIDLLLAMKYGSSQPDAGERLGKTGDGGIDGVIREDQLGLDRVYLQAKLYQPGNNVDSEAVRAFIGALIGRGAVPCRG